jgi:hypothetical protein
MFPQDISYLFAKYLNPDFESFLSLISLNRYMRNTLTEEFFQGVSKIYRYPTASCISELIKYSHWPENIRYRYICQSDDLLSYKNFVKDKQSHFIKEFSMSKQTNKESLNRKKDLLLYPFVCHSKKICHYIANQVNIISHAILQNDIVYEIVKLLLLSDDIFLLEEFLNNLDQKITLNIFPIKCYQFCHSVVSINILRKYIPLKHINILLFDISSLTTFGKVYVHEIFLIFVYLLELLIEEGRCLCVLGSIAFSRLLLYLSHSIPLENITGTKLVELLELAKFNIDIKVINEIAENGYKKLVDRLQYGKE